MKYWLFAISSLFLLAGCTGGNSVTGGINDSINDMAAKTQCMGLCAMRLINNTDLGNGPCLSNKIIEDWVCDVAHSPRTAADDDPANQCSEYGKTAHHFVEVDTKCIFIRES